MKRRAEHITRGSNRARDESIHTRKAHHHAAKVNTLRLESLFRRREVNELLLFDGFTRLFRIPRLEIGLGEFCVPLGIVNRLNALIGEAQTCRDFRRRDFGRRTKHDWRTNTPTHAGARRRNDARIHSLGENNRPIELGRFFNYRLYCIHFIRQSSNYFFCVSTRTVSRAIISSSLVGSTMTGILEPLAESTPTSP